MEKFNVLKVAKITGLALGIAGTLLTSWVTGKENEKILAKLVDQKFGE